MLFQLFFQHRLEHDKLVFLAQREAVDSVSAEQVLLTFQKTILDKWYLRPNEDYHPMVCDEESDYFRPQPTVVVPEQGP